MIESEINGTKTTYELIVIQFKLLCEIPDAYGFYTCRRTLEFVYDLFRAFDNVDIDSVRLDRLQRVLEPVTQRASLFIR